jgi:hypothetical protein
MLGAPAFSCPTCFIMSTLAGVVENRQGTVSYYSYYYQLHPAFNPQK